MTREKLRIGLFGYGCFGQGLHDVLKGYKIKLVPFVGKTNDNTITSFVLPRFITSDKYLYNVDNEISAGNRLKLHKEL